MIKIYYKTDELGVCFWFYYHENFIMSSVKYGRLIRGGNKKKSRCVSLSRSFMISEKILKFTKNMYNSDGFIMISKLNVLKWAMKRADTRSLFFDMITNKIEGC